MLPSYYEFHNPVKIISGKNALDNLPYELEQLGVSRPMVVSDRGVSDAGLIKYVKKAFGGSAMTIGAIFKEIPQDSSDEVVTKGAKIFRKNRCDSIVAVGGGSVIDSAKAINILVTEDSDDLLQFAGAEMLKHPLKPLIVVPTTSGTGSEVTLVAVISNPKKNVKMLFTSRHLLPSAAILDPRMTLTLPPFITAATAMDSMTHAIEGYTGIQRNPLSDAYSVAAIELIRQNIITGVRDGGDEDARLALANAATLAGASFSNSMVGMIHALGHATGAICNVPHGVAMSILLPFGLEYNMNKAGDHIARLLLPLGGASEYAATPQAERGQRVVALIRELQAGLFELCELPLTLKDAGVTEDKLELIARTALNDGSLIMNPEEVEFSDALHVLKKAFETS